MEGLTTQLELTRKHWAGVLLHDLVRGARCRSAHSFAYLPQDRFPSLHLHYVGVSVIHTVADGHLLKHGLLR